SQANLSPGDVLLYVSHARETNDAGAWSMRTVTGVTPYPAYGRAKVSLVASSGSEAPVPDGGRVYLMNQRAAVFGHNAPNWKAMPASVQAQYNSGGTEWANFDVTLSGGRLLLDNLYPRLLPETWMLLVAGANAKLYWASAIQTLGHADFTLTARCTAPTLLGIPDGSAGDISTFVHDRRGLLVFGQGSEFELIDHPLVNEAWGTEILAPFPNVLQDPPSDPLDEEDKIALDGVVPGLVAGRTLLVTGKRLRARVRKPAGVTLTARNGVSVSYDQGETLFVVARPIPIAETTSMTWHLADAGGFEGTVGLEPGDLGLEPAHAKDPAIAEVATIETVIQTPIRTTLRFTAPLKYWYDRATTTLSGNVAIATHGETVSEAIGSGDGSRANQRFTLKRAPLTWVSAATASGRQSTLEIRVDGVLWHEVSSFHDQSPNSRVYLTQRDEQGRTTVVFGDGVHGARLPSGLENVVARYRIGTGLGGEVGEGKVMLFQTRPLGLRSVTNPLPAVGAEAPATGDAAKPDIPASVLTLDRVVSVTDYETFAHTFAGIGKAGAALLRQGEQQRVHLTLALANGSPVPNDAVILDRLGAALDAVRDTTTPVEMAGYGRIWFRLAAKLRVAKDYLFTNVAAAASEAMTRAFSFERRAFGQGVSAAEVVALLQGVPGVEAVDLDGLAIKDDLSNQDIPHQVTARLTAEKAHWNGNTIVPAELLLLDPSPRGLTFTNAEEQL
ncbi:MAG TPA: putative baseplate assembly protein, partial [Polyangium sp.]|nr:putative baseplate assembly protein [Polyangium sp.]